MCGITGAAWTQAGERIDAATLARMTDVLRHRGPDDRGEYVSEGAIHHYEGAIAGVALGFRRLSIIDLAGGHQPMSNEDDSIWVAFNGEIYNHRDLRRRLQGSGHQFRTDCDTEVLVHLYEDDGPEFVRHLEGMFAIAIWDSKKRQLTLARDRLGQKPLVYRYEPQRLLFASELKSLIAAGVPREVDPSAIDEYLTYQYIPHPNTIFRGVRKLPPGHLAVYREGRLEVRPYWQPDFSQETLRPAAEYRELLRERLTAAVEKRLMADVPIGAFLSGGLDSSIVVALMQKLMGEAPKTFSIGFPIAEYDETSYAREVATHLGTDHHEFRVEPSAVEILPALAWHYDEPFADSSAIPTYYVSQLTRQHVTVALTGDGGDELFAGYSRYRAVALGAMVDQAPDPIRAMLTGRFWQRLPASPRQKSRRRQWKRFTAALAMPPQRRYLEWISIFGEARRAELYEDTFMASLPSHDPLAFLARAFARSQGRDQVTQASLADMITYLPCDLNCKVDTASMANSLECRQPFLDHHVAELAIEMPIHMKYRGRKGKRILMETFGHLLPASVLSRRKMGFGVPLDHWFRHELRDYARDVLLDTRCRQRGYFRPSVVERLLDEHISGKLDHASRLWALLFLELWHRAWVDPTTPSLTPPRALSVG